MLAGSIHPIFRSLSNYKGATTRVEQLQGAEGKHALLESQFENLPENFNKGDNHSSESSEFDSGAVSFKYPYAFKELLRRIDKFSGKNDENDFEVWLVDFTQATNDCV